MQFFLFGHAGHFLELQKQIPKNARLNLNILLTYIIFSLSINLKEEQPTKVLENSKERMYSPRYFFGRYK